MPRVFSNKSVCAHAPATSVIYGISNGSQWIYIGETDNLRDRRSNISPRAKPN
jgi:hypothetical protein